MRSGIVDLELQKIFFWYNHNIKGARLGANWHGHIIGCFLLQMPCAHTNVSSCHARASNVSVTIAELIQEIVDVKFFVPGSPKACLVVLI